MAIVLGRMISNEIDFFNFQLLSFLASWFHFFYALSFIVLGSVDFGNVDEDCKREKIQKKMEDEIFAFSNESSNFRQLPNEIILYIFSFLDLKAVQNSSLTCNSFFKLLQTESYWKEICKQLFSFQTEKEVDQFRQTLKVNWKQLAKIVLHDRVKLHSAGQRLIFTRKTLLFESLFH